jgi:hypothetical protein
MSHEEDSRKLTVGKRYRVTFHDCCVEGEIEGVFQRLEALVGKDDEFTHPGDVGVIYGYQYHFDFGWVGPDWGQWKAEEIPHE